MSRPAQALKNKILIGVSAAVVVATAAGFGSWAIVANSPSHKVNTVVNAQHKLAQISYHGQNGVNALTLLKKHATVQVKHYSFGDFVTSIDGVVGNGPKYWTLYVNGKESQIGASAYQSNNSDTITWKLQ